MHSKENTNICCSQNDNSMQITEEYKNLGVWEQRATIYSMQLAPSHKCMYKQPFTFFHTIKKEYVYVYVFICMLH